MTLPHILAFTLIALLAGWLVPRRWRVSFLLVASLAAVYWLQASTPVRHLDFWLPSASLALTVFVWAITHPAGAGERRTIPPGALAIIAVVLLIGLTRYSGALCCLTASRPPPLPSILLALGLALFLVAIPYLLPKNRLLPIAAIALILGLFITLKSELLSRSASAGLRALSGQSPQLASALDLPWLGFSYLAFRLLHILRDYQTGRLPAYSLGEFVAYAVFFPAYVAGPIDRAQRFMGDLRQEKAPEMRSEQRARAAQNLVEGGWRILLGVFKKFALADSLALFALNDQSAAQAASASWTWVLLYAYALRLYLDFSGYTDVAIGLGRLMDFKLPENFDRPYLKTNLTAFWNSWHITLAQWFRAYFFNPLTRALRAWPRKPPAWAIILLGQFCTMILIGLWHGITWNFLIWGAWHGLGLFIHNRWSDWARPRLASIAGQPRLKTGLDLLGWLLTFHFVVLGWVWFALSSPGQAWEVFLKLLGT
ncbi:MAG: MBOAT family protein [Anaerolineales bacterium]|nr:MBOAT family protein [Anaerolineales bacterium]